MRSGLVHEMDLFDKFMRLPQIILVTKCRILTGADILVCQRVEEIRRYPGLAVTLR